MTVPYIFNTATGTLPLSQLDDNFTAVQAFTQSGTGAVARTVDAKLKETVSVKDFGAVGDGVTDDTVAIQAAIDYTYSIGGGVVTIPNGSICLVDSNNINILSNVHLKGEIDKPGFPYPYLTNLRTVKNSIILNPLYSIRLANGVHDSASLTNLFIISKNVNLANWATCNTDFIGTAVIVGNSAWNGHGNDCYTSRLSIIGFSQAIRAYNCNGYNFDNIRGDNINGIWVSDITDISRGNNCHFFPYISVGRGGTGIQNWRNGIGFNLDYQGAYLSESFSFGHKIGFNICRDTAVLSNCWADANSTSTIEAETLFGGESYGFYSVTPSGGAANPNISHTLIGCGSSSHTRGFAVNTPTIVSGTGLKLIGCDSWGAFGKSHLYLDYGRLITSSCNFYNTSNVAAVEITANAQYYDITDSFFDNTGTVYSINPSSIMKGSFSSSNKFFGTSPASTVTFNYIPSTSTGHLIRAIGTSGYKMYGQLSGGTENAPTVVSNTNTLLALGGQGYTGSVFSQCGRIRFSVDDASVSSTSMGGNILFATQSTGGIANLVERITIDNVGNLHPLSDNVYSCGATGARWSSIWAANATIQTSDENTKTNIQPASLGLDFITALTPVSYKFKVGSNKVVKQIYRDADGVECDLQDEDATPSEIITEPVEGKRTHWGLLAQQVKSVLPPNIDFGGWVLTDTNDPNSEQGLRYEEFISPMIKAIQELSAKVIALEVKLESM